MNIVKCPFCEKEIENDSFFCDQCGEELKVCPSGHGFKKGKICSECGTKLVEAKNCQTQQSDAAMPSQPQQSNATYQQTVPHREIETAERSIRTTVISAEPKYLISSSLNARLELRNGAIIGRKIGDYIHVFGNQGYVSRTHARVQKNITDVWEIVDLNSTCGTFLNGQQLVPNQPATFKVGDTISFYDLNFIVSE